MIYQREGFLTPEECSELLGFFPPLTDGRIEAGSRVVRRSRTSFLDESKSPERSKLAKRVWDALVDVNARFYRFEIDAAEPMQLAEYPTGGEYAWHLDVGGDNRRRKLSASVQLTPPSAYEGGLLQFWGSEEQVSREQGALVIFPAYSLHRVTLVTMGTRRSLVAWATGVRSFR